jgi:hypothetical protein
MGCGMTRTLRTILHGGIYYTLQRRVFAYQAGWRPRDALLFVITDEVGDLYAFPRRPHAEYEWDRMFCALAQQEAA